MVLLSWWVWRVGSSVNLEVFVCDRLALAVVALHTWECCSTSAITDHVWLSSRTFRTCFNSVRRWSRPGQQCVRLLSAGPATHAHPHTHPPPLPGLRSMWVLAHAGGCESAGVRGSSVSPTGVRSCMPCHLHKSGTLFGICVVVAVLG